MTAVINGTVVTGTPEEIAKLMGLVQYSQPPVIKTGAWTTTTGTAV